MVVVSNSSPIIHLAKIGKLELLEALYGQVLIPSEVYSECTYTSFYQKEIYYISNAPWISIVQIENTKLFKLLYPEIDAGEAEALVLSLEVNADLVILDDMEARIKARTLELTVTGTLGVLLKAQKLGLLNSLEDEIKKLEKNSFRMSLDLKNRLLRQI
ncbi:MAG: DUF3368 domain-containing protein [Desulfohalobiaceae bacterium]